VLRLQILTVKNSRKRPAARSLSPLAPAGERARRLRAAEPGLTTVACVQAIQKKFGFTVHRRSLERALASKKTAASFIALAIPEGAVEAYEWLRGRVMQPDGRGEHLGALGVFVRHGLAAWAQLKPAAVPARPPSLFPCATEAAIPDGFGAELARLVAGLILSTRQEDLPHARSESYPAAS
jgi:hypothetical protein